MPSELESSAGSSKFDSSVLSAEEPAANLPFRVSPEAVQESAASPSPAGGDQVQQQQAQEITDDISLQDAFQEIQNEARSSPFPQEDFAPAFQNVVTMTGTVSTAPELKQLKNGTDITNFLMRIRRPGTSVVDTCASFTVHCISAK